MKKTHLCIKYPVTLIHGGTLEKDYSAPSDDVFNYAGSIQARKIMKENISIGRKNFLENDFSRGFIAYCRFKGEVVEKGRFRSKVVIEDVHRQQDGFIHAGVMATMADHTAGYAAFTTVDENFQILTIEFKINFLRPAYGGSLICKSRVIREGRRIIITESEVFDQRDGKEFLVAKALVTLMPVPCEEIYSKK